MAKSKNGGYHGVVDVTSAEHFRADCVKGNNAAVMERKSNPNRRDLDTGGNIHKHGCTVG